MRTSLRWILTILLGGSLLLGSPWTETPSLQAQTVQAGTRKEQTVYFNTNSRKYHHHSCEWARKCTRNCVTLPKSEAIRRGGIPCKVCGGG